MKLTTDVKRTVYLNDIPVGRLIEEDIDQVFYVPADGGFSQRLLSLNGLHLPGSQRTEEIDAIITLRQLLKREIGD